MRRAAAVAGGASVGSSKSKFYAVMFGWQTGAFSLWKETQVNEHLVEQCRSFLFSAEQAHSYLSTRAALLASSSHRREFSSSATAAVGSSVTRSSFAKAATSAGIVEVVDDSIILLPSFLLSVKPSKEAESAPSLVSVSGESSPSKNGAGAKGQRKEDTNNDNFAAILRFDGGSRQNPGPAGAGWAIWESGNANPKIKGYQYCGIATNNEAEYRALLWGLLHAIRAGYKSIHIQGDSKLVINQVLGTWKISPQGKHLQPCRDQIKALLDGPKIDRYKLTHIYREQNTVADSLSNLAMDTRGSSQETTS